MIVSGIEDYGLTFDRWHHIVGHIEDLWNLYGRRSGRTRCGPIVQRCTRSTVGAFECMCAQPKEKVITTVFRVASAEDNGTVVMLQRETGNERMKLVDIVRANERFKRERRNSRTNRNRTTAFYRVFWPFLYVKKQRVQNVALPVVPRQFWWALLLVSGRR